MIATMPARATFASYAWGAAIAAVTLSTVGVATAQSVAWVQQLGTAGQDTFDGVTADALGNIFAVGETAGSIFATNAGATDALMARYSTSGTLLGGLQDGTFAGDEFHSAAADGVGGVYVGGVTQGGGSLGPPSVGSGDVILGRIDASNSYVWLQQDPLRAAAAIAASPGGNFITAGGATSAVAGPHLGGGDVIVHTYDPSGALLWDDQTGTALLDGANSAAADQFGNFYVAGRTTGNWGAAHAGNGDSFVAKYDSLGVQQWVQQLGSAGNDAATSLATDFLGNVYVAGITDGSIGGPNAGSFDNFVIKYNAAGNFQWVKQFGTAALEANPTITTLGQSVWLGGSTAGALFGPNLGFWDVYVAQLDPFGNTTWSTQIGTSGFDTAFASTSDIGRVYFAGNTTGSFGGPHQGGDDAVLIAINALPPIPEPSSLALFACGSFAMVAAMTRRSLRSANASAAGRPFRRRRVPCENSVRRLSQGSPGSAPRAE